MARIVLVTGAAGGIGRTLVYRFVSSGDIVLALDRVQSGLDHVVTECAGLTGKVYPVVADLIDTKAVFEKIDAAIRTHGTVDILIANAGVASLSTIRKTTIESWHHDVDINLNGTMHSVQGVLEGMMSKKKGNIVVIGSVNALIALGHPAYSAAKAGLISYVKSLATELGPVGIRANIILPGTVRTPIWQEQVNKNPALFDQLIKWYPLGRIVEPNDIAEAAFFLASEAAAAITGAVLPVDCGLSAGNRLMASELTLESF
ncbi:MAG: SDR family oxidoreductase [Verrucomicrobia bacterium]|nr:SDR family oxidoreductase [Verrucomicrobiota bacterium]